MTPRLYIPRDATALSLGAHEVALAFRAALAARGLAVEILRTGTRGAFWLEPLVEVETSEGRVGYGNVTADLVPDLLDAGLLEGKPHAACIGPVERHPWFAGQQRVTYARCGVIDPLSLGDYAAHGGLAGLRKALAMPPAEIVAEVKASGLRGRGGAGFPTGIKWETVHKAAGPQKYIVCNADEGDSGTFADRVLMEGDPFLLIEGMVIAGLAVGADQGYLYIRSEYPHAIRMMQRALVAARAGGLLGPALLGSGRSFELEVRVGAGAYICGEETALLESLEGRRGQIRFKPPLPALKGLFGQPTVVNNVLSFAAVPSILADGAKAYADHGVGRSRGTLPMQLAGNVKRGGLIELAFGKTLGEVVEGFGGGTRSGRPIRALQVGGPLGAYFPASMMSLPLDYEAFAQAKGMLGHGGIVVFDDTVDLARQARFAMQFCALESCGKCTPCRIGSTRGAETVDKIIAGVKPEANIALLRDLCEVMTDGSLCALGGLTPLPVLSALNNFPEDFNRAATKVAAE